MLQQLLTENPNDCFLHHAMGIEYFSSEKFSEAIDSFKKAIAINENYLASYYQIGQSLEKTGNLSDAKNFYLKGIEIARIQNNKKTEGELNQALWLLED
jgi:tetratricopeptide (TPR) repeat protein